MNRRAYLIVLVFAFFSSTPLLGADTVVFVVRHAEKASDDGDPPLSAAGKKRAIQLMETLKNLRVTAIYHTDTLRAKETASPLSEKLTITPTIYTDSNQTWVDKVLSTHDGKAVLIIGHSNTVHEIVERISGKATASIGEHFDNFFVITISGTEKSVVRMKYGEAN